MRKLREILSVGTMLPTLLLSSPGIAAPFAPDAASAVSRDALRLAQAAPPAAEEDPRKHPPAQAPARPAPPAQAPARPAPPAPHAPPQAPAAPHAQPPAAPRVQAPPQAPAPTHVAPPPAVVRPQAPPQRQPEPARPAPQQHTPQPSAPQQQVRPPVPGPGTPVPGAQQRHDARPTAPQSGPAPAPAAPARVAPAAPQPVPAAPAPAAPAPTAPSPAPTAPQPPQGAGAPPPHPQGAGVPGHPPMPGQIGNPQPGAGQPFSPATPGAPPPPAPRPPAPEGQNRSGISPLGAAAVGAAVGVVGGMLLGGPPAHGLGDVQSNRRETRDGSTMIYSEPGRVIVRDGDGLRLRHDETERFRELGSDVRTERRGDEIYQVYDRPDGVRIITVTDADGRMIRRIRRTPDGREVVLIDNGADRRPGRWSEERIVVVPPPMTIPRDTYIVDAGRSDERVIYETLEAPPLAPLTRRYTLDDVRYNRDLRGYMRSVDVDTLTFETGSWAVQPGQYDRLATIAEAINRALVRNPDEVYLIEGHTDAVGSDVDNLSLSDRRAQSVAAILTREFRIPAENLVTQGYGEQFLKVPTDGPSRENRRVTVRRITPLINNANQR